MRTLMITNDFPPRAGGIQQYCRNLVAGLPPDQVSVYAPAWPGAAEFDAAQPFRVVRHQTRRMLPGRAVGDRAVRLVRELRPDVVVFGAAFPLGLLAGRITRETGVPCMGFTHGVEVAVGRVPLLRRLMTRVAGDLRLVTAVSRWSARRVERAVRGRCPVELLVSGVAVDEYHPGVDGGAVRARHGLGDAPVCVCISRLVPRKGQDRLIQAWASVVARVPDARLLVVGGGPYAGRLRKLAAASPVAGQIVFTGEVPWAELPAHYAAGDVYAMPCRTRWLGLDLEALGVVFLEAAATGLPVVAGRSGGAPETVEHGVTGLVVDGRRPEPVGRAVAELLADPERARAMGEAGRRRAEAEFSWEAVVAQLEKLLARAAAA
ncbi:MAG TPA: glycosyltransferase family 4 protein [Actinomycetes bacterium]|jgi:phosphatidylinositol alpha-1,6-mannosyltransferase|nr:glycosyltransferase family 4 protein [Actinomycetes bacterium]